MGARLVVAVMAVSALVGVVEVAALPAGQVGGVVSAAPGPCPWVPGPPTGPCPY
jgi:hypothetical protein